MRQRSVHRLFALTLAASSSIVGLALAQPGPPPGPRGDASGPPSTGPTSRPGWPRGWGRREDPPSGDEWDAIVSFMSANNPVRLEMLKRIEDSLGGTERPIAREVRRTLGRRFRELEGTRIRNPEIYPFALKRLQLEDNILGTLRDLRATGADQGALNAKLDGQIRTSVDNALTERRTRIEQLKAGLAREEKSLADDTSNVDKLAQAQRKKFETEMNAMIDFDAQNPPATTQATDAAR